LSAYRGHKRPPEETKATMSPWRHQRLQGGGSDPWHQRCDWGLSLSSFGTSVAVEPILCGGLFVCLFILQFF
jgi:hypothetical protein